ncbi:MAG: amn [Chlamydiales bacterium]|jgi:AMP nucleosidase|nr:amn [Chlamydiales bacterium]
MFERSKEELKIAHDSLERYSGSPVTDYCHYILLTNFPKYVEYFASLYDVSVHEGSAFKVAHCPAEDITILDFKMGSPVAALVVDLCSALPTKGCLLLGMCGGLRNHYKVGEYFVPVASVRGEGTSDFYFPAEVPAMANFLVQKAVTNVLETLHDPYHIGITHTTNIRFWEFNQPFKQRLIETQVQSIEMECATLFAASYRRKLSAGALLLISDLPLNSDGIKTKQSSQMVFAKYTAEHVNKGIEVIKQLKELQKDYDKRHAHRKPHNGTQTSCS